MWGDFNGKSNTYNSPTLTRDAKYVLMTCDWTKIHSSATYTGTQVSFVFVGHSLVEDCSDAGRHQLEEAGFALVPSTAPSTSPRCALHVLYLFFGVSRRKSIRGILEGMGTENTGKVAAVRVMEVDLLNDPVSHFPSTRIGAWRSCRSSGMACGKW